MNLRNVWYMRRRKRPIVPAPTTTPMPDGAPTTEDKYLRYSVYMRPWVLDREFARDHYVPHLADLDIVPNRRRLRSKTRGLAPGDERSYTKAWKWYIAGKVVSRHATHIIRQFHALNCGKSRSKDDEEGSHSQAKH